ncbi:MAG: VWA domain-containing protein [Salinirussus sp.]
MTEDTEDLDTARSHVLEEVVRLTRRLRAAGVDIPATAALPAVEALARIGLDDRERARTALFAALISDPADRDTFDRAFESFWYRLRIGLDAVAAGEDADTSDGSEESPAVPAPDTDGAPQEISSDGETTGGSGGRRIAETTATAGDDPEEKGHAGSYSTAGQRSAVTVEDSDDRIDRAALERFESALASLSGRRWTRAGAGEAVDARRALRESLDTGGVTMELPRRVRQQSALRTTLLVDVSRSVLDAIDREYLLEFVDGLVEAGRDTRVYFFDTDLREVTDVVAGDRGEAAVALAEAEVDWGGGTRIGDSLAALRQNFPHAVDRRTAVVVISDGLDVGEIDDLERGMAWLARRAAAIIWLNPLAAAANYEPTCRGMAAALPYIDGLFAFAGNADLAEAGRQLERHGPKGSVGFRQDFRDREVAG